MPSDNEEAPAPKWTGPLLVELERLHTLGQVATLDTYRALLSFLGSLEIEDFPRPQIEVPTPTVMRLTWANGRKTMRLEATPTHMHITTSHPDPDGTQPGRGRLVDDARRTFDWYRSNETARRRNDP